MCGIAGWVDFDRDLTSDRDRAVAEAMTRTMACRGPDEEGLWLDPHVALGNRRLAVIDVEGGQQPMTVEGLAVLTYSGEAYNFQELRSQLESRGYRFRTNSDTDVVLRAYIEWGRGLRRAAQAARPRRRPPHSDRNGAPGRGRAAVPHPGPSSVRSLSR